MPTTVAFGVIITTLIVDTILTFLVVGDRIKYGPGLALFGMVLNGLLFVWACARSLQRRTWTARNRTTDGLPGPHLPGVRAFDLLDRFVQTHRNDDRLPQRGMQHHSRTVYVGTLRHYMIELQVSECARAGDVLRFSRCSTARSIRCYMHPNLRGVF